MAQRPFPSAFPAPRTSSLVPSLPFSLGMHTLPCNNFHTFVSRPISPTCATNHDTRRLAIITGRKGSPTSLRVGHETRKRLAWPVYSIFPLCPYLDEPPRTFLSRHLTTKHIRYRRILRITTTAYAFTCAKIGSLLEPFGTTSYYDPIHSYFKTYISICPIV